MRIGWARLKTRKPQKHHQKPQKFFYNFFSSDFLILTNTENRKLGEEENSEILKCCGHGEDALGNSVVSQTDQWIGQII